MNAPVSLPQRGREIAELARAIRELAGDDDAAFVDSLDGETDAVEAARKAVRYLFEADAHAEACKGLSDTYAARKRMFEDRAARTRGALLQFLTEIGEKSLPLPEATLTVAKGQPKMLGEPDEANLPIEFWVTKREPNRAAIKEALKAGRQIDGVALSNAQPTLVVRVR